MPCGARHIMTRAPSFPTLPPVADPNMPGRSRVFRLFTNLQSLSLFLLQLLIKTDKEEEGKPVRDATVRREQDPPACILPPLRFRPFGLQASAESFMGHTAIDLDRPSPNMYETRGGSNGGQVR
ncbi:hypothetical protein CCHR01_19142 [Colletotrichum chrysophilum]|uniref:Uncharacterized protein n=1 Tax=Colletotrichum chrysophilum TaxID=1836956 RepID=A0AAD8ZZ63_9PEZI|nr:hypothetical protein CCHR01_19142 [Colletotrichum chrysophilum]